MQSMKTIVWRLGLIAALCFPGVLSAQQQPRQEQQTTVAPARDNSRFVVFIHTGGNEKADDKSIREIAVALLGKRYVVRAPDKERDEVGGPGVDYFADTGRDAAQEVADVVNEKLKRLGLLPDENKKLKPRLQRQKNPPGYLGVWLF